MSDKSKINTIAAALQDVPEVQALFLSGSHGNGMADAYSDLDFVLVCENGATDAIAAAWREAVSQTGTIVLWWDRTNIPVLINAITEDWMRIDLIILKPEQLASHYQNTLKVVFDPERLYDQLTPQAPSRVRDPDKFLRQVEDFIRILGLLPLAEGRKEYINGILGVYHLRQLLVDLLVEETNAPHRGGILHLNRLLTDAQQELLISLPPPLATREGMIAAHLAYAGAFLPRARRQAAELGVVWPDRFEEATWKRLKQTLSLERPYDPQVAV
ncbi:aminoglycoside 6-adenylyltransferase [Roseobacter litoralis]|uniref:aminoglycoside 6-adenylyltransferase n=1 Tax=Roseobacter litoralis TaxID=42443 RepID=UPI002494BD33|nr:aminoglycoside 6-adenylyltransferase [Roseobacter litoralis]